MNPNPKNPNPPKPILADKTISAFSVIRVEGGWAYVRLELDRDFKVRSHTVSNPDMKPIITERFRIEVGKYWGKLDEQII